MLETVNISLVQPQTVFPGADWDQKHCVNSAPSMLGKLKRQPSKEVNSNVVYSLSFAESVHATSGLVRKTDCIPYASSLAGDKRTASSEVLKAVSPEPGTVNVSTNAQPKMSFFW